MSLCVPRRIYSLSFSPLLRGLLLRALPDPCLRLLPLQPGCPLISPWLFPSGPHSSFWNIWLSIYLLLIVLRLLCEPPKAQYARLSLLCCPPVPGLQQSLCGICHFPFFILVHSVPTTRLSQLLLKHTKHILTSGSSQLAVPFAWNTLLTHFSMTLSLTSCVSQGACPTTLCKVITPSHSYPRLPSPAFLCSMTAITMGPQALVLTGMPAL